MVLSITAQGEKTPARNIQTQHSWTLKLSLKEVYWTGIGPEIEKKERLREGRSL